ncbi:MAG: type II toxin-antitoxin system VapC family toxin [Chloroflexia bacterium]|nr:type II toxin-antitoxin system VapC family toxin [Chloroflexia bacterium]
MYLLDTDWIIQALGAREPAAQTLRQLAGSRIHISIVTLGEIYERAFVFANPQAHLTSFRAFLNPYQVLSLSDPIMERFAETRAFLRRRGQLISDFDILIAATALHHDLTVLTFNLRHFGRIPDLKVYHPN